jgi:glutamyl-tRNA(Gln) amidotransferase subunit D
MDYPGRVKELLDAAGVREGDEVEVVEGDRTHRGVVMPHHAFSGDDVLTIKLDTGYNMGIVVKDSTAVTLLRKAEARPPAKGKRPPSGDLPTVAILGTGGTIASYVDYRTGAVHPALSAEDLTYSVPELSEICDVRARVLYTIFSENMKVEYWQHLAEEVAKELNEGAAGVIVPHGTDTMGFTAAALAFMLGQTPGPVILVGSQRSSDRPSSDAFVNLLSAAHLASADLGEVVVLMHGETSDSACTVHRGTKVRKMHSSRRDAFRSINIEPLGRVSEDGKVELSEEARPRGAVEAAADTAMEPNVALVHFYPGMGPGEFEALTSSAKGVVIAGTGLGHVSEELIPSIRKAVDAGVAVVMATQTLYGRVDMYVYETGRDLVKAGVIPAEDMLPETAFVKLMWVLGHTTDPDEVRRQMRESLVGEINPSLRVGEFPPAEA